MPPKVRLENPALVASTTIAWVGFCIVSRTPIAASSRFTTPTSSRTYAACSLPPFTEITTRVGAPVGASTAAHAGYDDDDPRGSRLEFVLHTEAGLARQLSVMGGRRVSTLALGSPLEGEPERALLEKGVQNRDAAGTLRKILVRASLPDPWDPSSYIEGGAMFAIACTIGAAPIVGGLASPRSNHRAVETPPGYLTPYARKPKEKGPAALLQDGAFCGHGEPRFGIWDIELSGAEVLLVELPQPAEDDTSPEDTSWFALAVQCATCRRAQIVWDHESA